MRFTLTQIQNLKCAGRNQHLKELCKVKPTKSPAKGLQFIIDVLIRKNIPFKTEYTVKKGRKFKFDIALPEYRLYIEFEGMVANGKGGHQTMKGYTGNCIKYNIAVLNGWVGLRYTFINYREFENDIVQFLGQYTHPIS